ncbi:MAG: phosphoglycerate kinase [bacterium]|nr:phosphoglycerate kinase [bacterium]
MNSIRDFNVEGKRILVRCDFNVPLDERGDILDDFKIKESLPTLRYLLEHKAKIVLMSHLGNPEGKIVPHLKLDKVRDRIESLLDVAIMKSFGCVGRDVENQLSRLKKGEILLLENLRFNKGEIENNAQFAGQLSHLGQMYINDAFAESHRPYASMIGVPLLLPSFTGLLLEKEIKNLDKILKKPKHPLIAIVGGIKIETKVTFIDAISKIADAVIVSPMMKKGIVDKKIALLHPEKIIAPVDEVGAFDIGEKTIALFTEKILPAKTIFWNGPFGKFEDSKYKKGTLAIAKAIIKSGAYSVVGGGETIEFLDKEGILSQFSHVSTGGGAMLDYLSGQELPGLKALEG